MFFSKNLFNFSGFLLRHVSLFLVLVLFSFGVFSYTRAGAPEQVSAATSSNLNFQGRLLNSSGSVVPDGYYNLEFKLFNASSSTGSSEGSCAGDANCLWTETRDFPGTDDRVRTVNGYFSVNLGSVTALPDINWDQDLWLSMNVGGGGTSPAWDGQMTPKIKLTAVPFAQAAKNVYSGDTSSASTNSDNVSILTGNATGATSNSGNIAIDVGTATGTAGTISVGTANTSGITIGYVGVLTDIGGDLTVSGSQFTNTGSTLNSAQTLTDFPSGGDIGTAAATVDVATSFSIGQTTAGQILSLPDPTDPTAGRTVFVLNTGTTSFTMHSVTIPSGYGQIYIWDGSNWILAASGGDSGGGTITLQAAYDGGNTLTTTNARNIDFTLADTATDANFIIDIATGSTGQFQIQANGTDILQIGSAGQLQLDAQGSSGGILLGGDANLYRSESGELTTDGDLITGGNITVGSSALFGEIAEPSSTVGYGTLYVDSSDSNLYYKDSGGTTYDLTASVGVSQFANLFYAYDATGNINLTSGWTNLTLDTEVREDSNFTHANDSAEITLNASGWYEISYDITTYITSGSNRTSSHAKVQEDTGSGYTDVPGSMAEMYNRNNTNGANSGSATVLRQFNTGDKIKLVAEAYGGSDTVLTQANGVRLNIRRVVESGSVTGTGAIQSATAGQIAFYNSTGTTVQGAAGLNWDDSTTRLGVGAPAANGILTVGTNTTSASGGIYFGTDTNLYRSGSGELATGGALVINADDTDTAISLYVNGSDNPAIEVGNATDLAYVTDAGNWSDQSAVGDSVLRAGDGNLILSARNGTGDILFTTGASDTTKATLTNTGQLQLSVQGSSGGLEIGGDSLLYRSAANTLTAEILNTTTGINTGAGAGTQRIDSSGNLVNIGNFTTTGSSTFTATGANGFTFKPGTDNTGAFQIQNAGGTSLFRADTTNSNIIVENATLLAQDIDVQSGTPSTISRVNRTSASSSEGIGTASFTPGGTFTPNANRLLVAYVFWESQNQDMATDGSDVTISDGSLTWVPITGAFNRNDGWGVGHRAFYAYTTATPPSNIQVTVDAGAEQVERYHVAVDEMDGVDSVTPIAGAISDSRQSGDNDTWSDTLGATPVSNDWKIALSSVEEDTNDVWDVPAGWAEIHGLGETPDTTVVYDTGVTSTSVDYDLGNLEFDANTDTTYGGFILKAAATSATINLGSTNATQINVGSSGSAIQLATGTGGVTIQGSNSATAFRIQDSGASNTLLTADTTSNRIVVGDGDDSSGANTTLFVVDSASTANAPTGVNGGIFYDTTLDKLRCYENGNWVDCVTSISSGGDIFFLQGGNSFGETATLGTLDTNSLEILTDGNTILTFSGVNGGATFQNSVNSASALRVSNTSGHSVLTVNTEDGEVLLGSPNNLNASLVFSNDTNSNTTTVSASAPSTDQSISFPNASGTVCLTSGNCVGVGGTGDLLQNGNSFGTAVTIGSNDANNLNLETDGQTRLTVDTSGNVAIGDTNTNDRLYVASSIENSGVFEVIWSDDFDPGIDGSMWDDTNSNVADTECDSFSGNSLRFTTNGDREAETIELDVSSGGFISFYLYSPSGGGGDCESPDNNEDFVLEYSTNGSTWIEINEYESDVDPLTLITESIPAGAQTASTQFRWGQTNWSGSNSDHWAIDSAQIMSLAGGGQEAITDDFDPSIDGSQWSSTSNVSADTTCGGSGSVSGNALRFNGGGTREAETVDIDASGGGYISFYTYAPSGGGTGCEEPDAGDDENMVLEYSNNDGGDWTEINEYSPTVTPITEIVEFIPSGAQTSDTRFRWRQANHSGNNFDNWTIDNVSINVNNPAGSVGSTIYGYNNSSDFTDLLRLASDVGGTESIKFRVDSSGNVYADGVFYGAGGVTAGDADLAEIYQNHDNAKPGDVVIFSDSNTVEKSTQPYQRGLAGVVSTAPGFTLNADEDGVPVALSGRVPVRVSTENGEIQKGDYLTSGPGGVAIKATSTGPVIGTAMEDASENGKIDVFVHLGYYNPADDALFDDNVLLALQSSDVTVANLNTAGQLNVGALDVEGEESIFIGEYGDAGSGELQVHAEKGFHFTTGEDAENEVFSIDENGYVVFKNALDSDSAFAIQNAAGDSVFKVDTVSGNASFKNDLEVNGSAVIQGTVYADNVNADNGLILDGGAGGVYINIDDNSSGGGAFSINSGLGPDLLSLTSEGFATFKNGSNSTSAFQIQNAGGTNLFQVDTQNNRVYIGNSTPDAVGTLLVLDNKNTAGDPAGVPGAIYFNSSASSFRCYDGTSWSDCGQLSQSGYFSDSTEDLLDNTIINLWNSEEDYPNLNLSKQDRSIIISVSIKGIANGSDSEYNIFTIHRAIDEDPDCEDTRVGIGFGGFTNGNNAPLIVSSTFRDTPVDTGNIRYTVCHNGEEAFSSSGSGNINNQVQDITITLQESEGGN